MAKRCCPRPTCLKACMAPLKVPSLVKSRLVSFSPLPSFLTLLNLLPSRSLYCTMLLRYIPFDYVRILPELLERQSSGTRVSESTSSTISPMRTSPPAKNSSLNSPLTSWSACVVRSPRRDRPQRVFVYVVSAYSHVYHYDLSDRSFVDEINSWGIPEKEDSSEILCCFVVVENKIERESTIYPRHEKQKPRSHTARGFSPCVCQVR